MQMDNNRICAVHGSPFDDMPRLRVLSLRSNRMTAVSENAFKRLRSNIAVLDIDGNSTLIESAKIKKKRIESN